MNKDVEPEPFGTRSSESPRFSFFGIRLHKLIRRDSPFQVELDIISQNAVGLSIELQTLFLPWDKHINSQILLKKSRSPPVFNVRTRFRIGLGVRNPSPHYSC